MSKKGKDKGICVLFFLYLLFVIIVFVFKYPWERLMEIADSWTKEVVLEGLHTANFHPFKTIKMYIKYADRLNSVENLGGNILVLVPFGFLFPYVWKGMVRYLDVLLAAFLFVVGIELFQLFSSFGAFDVDDILLNCMGATIGYLLWWSLIGRKAKRMAEK